MESKVSTKTNKKSFFPKFLKNKYFVFGFSLFLFICSGFILFLMDRENIFRPSWLEVPFFLELLKFLHISENGHNVGISTWLLFFIIFGTFWISYLAILLHKSISKKLNKDSLLKTNQPLSKTSSVKFNLLFWTIFALVLAAAVVVLIVFFPWKELRWDNPLGTIPNFLLSLLILICLLLVIPVALLIIILIFRLIILLLSLIIGGVARTVVASPSYQDALNASEQVGNEVRKRLKNGQKGGSGHSDYLFPALIKIDEDHVNDKVNVEGFAPLTVSDDKLIDELKDVAFGFQSFLANEYQLYYDIDIIRSFIAGLYSSRLVLLEGLSGTGKSTLPRRFLEYIGGRAEFYPVQATWRDKSDIVGYYSDFVGQYKESEFLKQLYEANYNREQVNFYVLDEANISRIEYYFATFLSVFEYPSEDWKISLMQLSPEDKTPKFIENGQIRIPTNSWFIGTLNVDDSTFTVSDKVYDRAIVINFEEINTPFKTDYPYKTQNLSNSKLINMFESAALKEEFKLSSKEKETFLKLCDFTAETFDIRFGNRIMNQIENFLPSFVAMGGTKERALDIMYARKILRKLDAQYETYVDIGLAKLEKYLARTYGKGVFKETENTITKYRKKFI